MYLLCANSSGQGLSRSKLDPMAESEKVSKLREKAANVTQLEASNFNLIYCGKVLDDDRTLESYGIRSTSCVQVMAKAQVGEVTKVAPVPATDENVQQFMLAFGMAVKNYPSFIKIASRAAKNMDDMCASVPGLDQDPVACAFLSKPELMLSLLHPQTFKYVAEKHPGLIEVANNLAALILETKASEKDSEPSAAAAAAPNPFAYHLDEMSDDEDYEEMDMEPQPGGSMQPGFQPISAEQLRAALSAATAGGAQGLFGGVTGMGPAAPAPSMPPSVSNSQSPAITQDQLAAALAAATGSGPPASSLNPFSFGGAAASQQPATAAAEAGGAPSKSWDEEVAKMKEMGIVDEGLARKALQIMGGDLQAAIELIFSGWDGMDDSTN